MRRRNVLCNNFPFRFYIEQRFILNKIFDGADVSVRRFVIRGLRNSTEEKSAVLFNPLDYNIVLIEVGNGLLDNSLKIEQCR